MDAEWLKMAVLRWPLAREFSHVRRGVDAAVEVEFEFEDETDFANMRLVGHVECC